MFLEHQISILKWFLKDQDGLLKIQLCHHRKKWYFKIYLYEKVLLNISQYYSFTIYQINATFVKRFFEKYEMFEFGLAMWRQQQEQAETVHFITVT